MLLEIKDLHASINGKEILKGVNLNVDKGEIHAIMGPNGNGKSTLASVIAGKEMFHVDSGEVLYKGKNLFGLNVEERACEGIFLGFQYPVEIPGVSIASFMRAAINEQRKYKGLDAMDPFEFMKYMEEKQALVGMTDRSWRFSTKPIPAWTSMPCASWPAESTNWPARTTPLW